MRGSLRANSVLCLAFVMIGSFAMLPITAFAQADPGSTTAADVLASASADVTDFLSSFERWDGDSAGIHPALANAAGPIEMIIQFQGRSLAAEQSYREAQGVATLDGPAQQAFVAGVHASHADVSTAVLAAGGTVLYDYAIVYNGIDAVLDRAALSQIAGLPGVVQIQPTQVATLDLDNSVPFILGGKTYAQLGADGTGVRIAVIDTGIDYTHAALGGSGNPATYKANNPKLIEPGTFPTAKVIGGTDLVGESYDARGARAPGGLCRSTPVPDPDPVDVNGHGTHSSDTAAGFEVKDPSGNVLTPHGVAPGASLYAVKIFSGCASDGTASTSTANVVAAIEWSMDPNHDGDTSDHADVINMSLGGVFGRDTTPSSVASDAAASLGVIVVASAGNSGNIPFITGSPAAASGAISVAAGNDPGIKAQLVKLAGSGTADGNYESVPAAFGPSLSSVGTKSGHTSFVGDACAAFAGGSLTGQIPLIVRGGCTFVVKVKNAQNAGAIAAVVYNQMTGQAPIVMGGTDPTITIPSVMVGNVDGLKIRAALGVTSTFTLDPANQVPIPNRLAPFTSRGPRFNDAAIKPDVTAPGVAILSAEVGTGTKATSVSGTSFSAPHVAGAAAILRQLHPSWSVAEIKSLLMDTATDARPDGSTPFPVSLMGAGRVRVDVAAVTGSVVVPGSVSFGVEERSASGVMQFDRSLEVRNKGSSPKTFGLSSAFRVPSDVGIAMTLVHPASVAVGGGASTSFTLSLRINFAALGGPLSEKDGFLTLTQQGGGDVLRVPFLIVPIARAAAHATSSDLGLPSPSFTVRNDGIRPTRVDIYQFGATDPNEDLIHEPTGAPNDPDDWFDIQNTGARTYTALIAPGVSARILEFAVGVFGRRSAPNIMVTDIFVNTNANSPTPDFLIEVADLGLFTTGSFDGRMASAVFALKPKANAHVTGLLEFVINSDRNTGWQIIPIVLDDLTLLDGLPDGPKAGRADVDLSYFAVTTDLQTGAFDVSPSATFNAKMVELDASPNVILALNPGATTTIQVLARSTGALLLVYRNNVAGSSQTQVVTVHS